MSKRSYPRDQQRRYKEKRQKQAKLVADRLLGKKRFISLDEAADIKVLKARQIGMSSLGMYTHHPRTNFIISGIGGV